MMDKENILILFYKYPEKGEVKTRLAQSVGDQQAFEIYNCMLNDLYTAAGKISSVKIVNSTRPGGIPAGQPAYDSFLQQGADLGEKMLNAFRKVFSLEFSRAILIGSDCPEITSDLLNEAFDSLSRHDYVIGPAGDGGYYLIGMNRGVLCSAVFEDIAWSTSNVLSETTDRLDAERYRYKILKELKDIDTLEDGEKFFDKNRENQDSETIKYLSGMRKDSDEI